jgi:uncharacterized membrane protein
MGIIIGSCVPEPEQDSSYRMRRVLYGELAPGSLALVLAVLNLPVLISQRQVIHTMVLLHSYFANN